MNERKLQITDDGSHTLYSEEARETYHSTYGAIQESEHIFINACLNTDICQKLKNVRILEVGTGTGLNILLAYNWSVKSKIPVTYYGYEPFPIRKNETLLLNYPEILGVDKRLFFLMHDNKGKFINLSNKFSVFIVEDKIENVKLHPDVYDVVFFDAFSPDAQPEIWTVEIFNSLFKSIKRGGVLTTYSCKGNVKRSLEEVGFVVEKLPGPPGKREFLRAWK
ncbi:MAG: SAM-dependent methyltransferase [Bacteroidetes bacterium]|nr:SAM-dependent methyltransferase [Bacteroidota bacterium]|tara:strand:+ start:277 stop:942 length:666 start_codon:yes stop_codon:yes gene_type:complete